MMLEKPYPQATRVETLSWHASAAWYVAGLVAKNILVPLLILAIEIAAIVLAVRLLW